MTYFRIGEGRCACWGREITPKATGKVRVFRRVGVTGSDWSRSIRGEEIGEILVVSRTGSVRMTPARFCPDRGRLVPT
jgi:hypothetical protein